jgi:hypothetical protein
MKLESITKGFILPIEGIQMTDLSKKAVIVVKTLQDLTEQLVEALEKYEDLKAQINATGFTFTSYNDNYASIQGLEHIDGDVVNSVISGFDGLIGYLDAVGQYRRDPLNKFRTGKN